MCDDGSTGNGMPSTEQAHRLNDSSEMKQEPVVKDEPLPEGEVNDLPASKRRGNHGSIVAPIVFDDEDDSSDTSYDEVKIEVKEENEETKEKESKSNDDDAMDNHKGDIPPRGGAPNSQFHRNGAAACNHKKSTKGKVLKQHKCEQCEYATKYKGDLKRHLIKHTGKKPFPCDYCAKAFTRQQYLNNHMKLHVTEFLFNCATCLKGFDEKNEKMEHETKCKTRRYECHLCKNSIGTSKCSLAEHMCVHSGEKSFNCEKCSQKFTQKSSLSSHMKRHTDHGPRSFRCSKCRLGFSEQGEMILHQKKCNRRVYTCYACGKFIGLDKMKLVQHMRIHSGVKPFKCDKCPRMFNQKGGLRSHMNMHSRSLPWKCLICRQGFTKQSERNAHQRNCSRRVYECSLCKKFFGSKNTNLENHMRTHSGEKPFQCEWCRKRFSVKGNLKQHMKSIHDKKR